MKRKHEEFSRASLDTYFHEQLGIADIRWEDVEVGPPDYRVTLRGRTFAVEATTLVEGSNARGGGIRFSAMVSGLASCIEAEANAQGILDACYHFTFHGPFERPGKMKAAVRTGALDYIRSTQGQEMPGPRLLYDSDGQECNIERRNGLPPGVSCQKSLSDWAKFGSQIEEDARQLLQAAVTTKTGKLADVDDPAILLLLDAYWFAEPATYQRVAGSVDGLAYFEAVFLVHDKGEVLLLHGGDEWRPGCCLR